MEVSEGTPVPFYDPQISKFIVNIIVSLYLFLIIWPSIIPL